MEVDILEVFEMHKNSRTLPRHSWDTRMDQAYYEQSRKTVDNGSSLCMGPGIWNDARRNRKGNCGVAAKRELKLDSDPSNVNV
jgi:hypothetical protein